ncbi:unnamed protein product [Closterium sp. NIES-53]
MPRQPKKAAPVNKGSSGVVRASAAKGHQSEPATPKPLIKEVGGPFADDTRISLVKKLAALKFLNPDVPATGGSNNAKEGEDNENEVTPPMPDPKAPAEVEEEEEEEEEDDGYLSDDPEEPLDPVKAGEIAARA